jgi:putative phosphoesterase
VSPAPATPDANGQRAPLDVLVLADTHIKRGSSRSLPRRVRELAEQADVILHAGDIVIADVLEDLASHAPVHAVLGNNDHTLVGQLPDRLEVELAGVRVAMVHDSGARAGRERRMRRWFPDADIVVFGHSHEPVDAEGEGGQRLFNPGSAVQRRRQPRRTMGLLTLDAGRVTAHEVVPLG